jgi:hypothetical protein
LPKSVSIAQSGATQHANNWNTLFAEKVAGKYNQNSYDCQAFKGASEDGMILTSEETLRIFETKLLGECTTEPMKRWLCLPDVHIAAILHL